VKGVNRTTTPLEAYSERHVNPRSSTLFYGWVVVAVTALVLVVTAGARSAPGAWLLEMERDTGWSRGALSFAASLGLILFGLGGPISGGLMARFGVRKVTLLSLALTALSLWLSSRLTSQLELNLFFGLLSGIGTGLVASVLGATVANRWFLERRGFVIGIFGASTSAGQLIFYPLLTTLAVTIGWRSSAVVLALIAVAISVPVLLLLREDPADVDARPLGAKEGEASRTPGATPGIMARALKTPEFWLLAITFYICGATSNGLIGQHLIPHAVDHGLKQPVAAGLVALMGAFNFVGTIASGWLTDRYDPRKLLLCYYGFRGLSLLLLPFMHDVAGLSVFAVLFGLDYIATVPPTVMLVARHFGRHNVGVVYGWVFAAHQLGAALAAWIGGVTRDALGEYTLAFLVAGGIAMLGGALALTIKRDPPPLVAGD
jgi:predicted MFS family arabinose efflux permease